LDDDLRPVALAKLQDYTNEEIARNFHSSLSIVDRSLRLIRKIWQQEVQE
jgi:DNA-directed RNA polymerase specialized sigma24 family protein